MEKLILRYLRENSNSNWLVLDAGCGNGNYAKYAARYNREVKCVDIKSPEQLGLPQFFLASIAKLPFSNNYFDFIYSLSVLEFIADDKAALQEISRVLKPHGRVLLSLPTSKSIFRVLRDLEILFGIYAFPEFQVKNFHYYDKQRIKNVLPSDFRILKISGYNYNFLPRLVSFPVSLSVRFLKKIGIYPHINKFLRLKRNSTMTSNSFDWGTNRKEMPHMSDYFSDYSYHYIVLVEKIPSSHSEDKSIPNGVDN